MCLCMYLCESLCEFVCNIWPHRSGGDDSSRTGVTEGWKLPFWSWENKCKSSTKPVNALEWWAISLDPNSSFFSKIFLLTHPFHQRANLLASWVFFLLTYKPECLTGNSGQTQSSETLEYDSPAQNLTVYRPLPRYKLLSSILHCCNYVAGPGSFRKRFILILELLEWLYLVLLQIITEGLAYMYRIERDQRCVCVYKALCVYVCNIQVYVCACLGVYVSTCNGVRCQPSPFHLVWGRPLSGVLKYVLWKCITAEEFLPWLLSGFTSPAWASFLGLYIPIYKMLIKTFPKEVGIMLARSLQIWKLYVAGLL